MPRKLVDVDIDKVAGVDAAANNRRWLIIKKKLMKTEDGEQYPIEAYAYAPDPEKPETWIMRMWESPEKKVTAKQINTMLPSMKDLPAEAKARMRAAWRSLHGEDEEMPMILKGGETLEKSGIIKQVIDALQNLLKGSETEMSIEKMLDGMDVAQQTVIKAELAKRDVDIKKHADEVAALKTEVAKLTKKEDPPEDIWKGVNPEVKKQFETMQKQADDLKKAAEEADRIAKEEREKRIAKEFIQKAVQYPLVGKAEDVAEMLRKAYEVSEDHGKKLEATFKAADARIKEGDLLKELGSGLTSGAQDAWNKIEEMAKGIVSKDAKMTQEQAVAKVIDDHPELYKQYLNEQRAVS